ncbi:MAG: bifunctional riboflavin kinase/FAD synthetase [Bacteroidetes bacterium]|nr:MAG: bifunctional riboflavin kinase/FAD synthetase [Bacteroidota bacterium]
MKEHNPASEYKNTRGSVVTIGTFDGVHLGHRSILTRLVETAKNDDLDSVLLTFFPHPRMVLQKDSGLKLINSISEKKKLLETIGIDHFVVQPFTKEFSRLTALEYVRDLLVNQLNAKKIIIGYDHRFGRNRTANIENLREYGITYSFEVEEIDARELDEVAISSTKIRKSLEAGDITTANKYLGYSFMLNGTVERGKGIGKTLEYPTANLKIDEPYKLIPKKGVYLVKAVINGNVIYGLTSIGTNPTVGGTEKTIETYFLDFSEDLYNQQLCLKFITRIRDEESFESVAELKEAIRGDEAFARDFLADYE